MIDYTLAKSLKDAGFPQEGSGVELHTPDCKGWDAPSDCTHKTRAYSPTLSEIIEACDSIVLHGPGTYDVNEEYYCPSKTDWVAFKEGKRLGEGKTPEEAVARLWLALNKLGL